MVQKEVEIENYGGVFEMRDFEGFFSEVLILADKATEAGMELIFEGKKHTVLTYPVSAIDELQSRVGQFIDSRFESFPNAASKVLIIKKRGFTMHPSYVIHYE